MSLSIAGGQSTMKATRFEVLAPAEVEQIDAASMEILTTVGVQVDYAFARSIFREAGAQVDDEQARVFIPQMASSAWTLAPIRSALLHWARPRTSSILRRVSAVA
jgi:trimethylamine:corrinoid methyltransferase-like protein